MRWQVGGLKRRYLVRVVSFKTSLCDVLGDADIMQVITGTLTSRETARLAQTNQEIRQAVATANERRLQDIGDDPRVQQMALRVRSHLQKPVVRTGVFWEQTALLAPPTTDTEVIIDRSTGIADVSARQRRHTLLDLRHAALSADNPRATTQPNLVDSVERLRSLAPVGKWEESAPRCANVPLWRSVTAVTEGQVGDCSD